VEKKWKKLINNSAEFQVRFDDQGTLSEGEGAVQLSS